MEPFSGLKNITDFKQFHSTQGGALCEMARLAKQGDAEALRVLSVAMQGDLDNSVDRCIKKSPKLDSHREDVEREAFLALQELTETYEIDPAGTHHDHVWFGNFARTHLDSILERRCQRFFSKNEQGAGLDEMLFTEMPRDWEPMCQVDLIKAVDYRIDLENAINTLTLEEQQVVALYYVEDMTQEQVAQQIGVSVTAVKGIVSSATQKLRARLEGCFVI